MGAPETLTVSVSQLKEFLICPRRYQLHRVLGVEPEFTPVPLVLGSAAHSAFAHLYSTIADTNELPAVADVIQVFRDAWDVAIAGPIAVKLDEDAANPIDVGVKIVRAMHEHVAASGAVEVVGVEVPFSGVVLFDPDSGEVLDEQLTGFIDLVVRERDRNVIVEHKTGARKWAQDQLDHDFQTTAYQIAAPTIGLGDDVGLRYQVVTKTKVAIVQVEDVVRDELATTDFLRTASGVLRAIGSESFWPVRSWACKSCPYSHACAGKQP